MFLTLTQVGMSIKHYDAENRKEHLVKTKYKMPLWGFQNHCTPEGEI